MPNETDYLERLPAEHVRLRIRFETDGGKVVSFLVQLETLDHDEWKAVRRYDDHHGRPHLDVLDRWGRERQKIWLEVDRSRAMTEAIRDFKTNWPVYVSEFFSEKLS